MRRFAPRTLIPLLALLCLPAFTQQNVLTIRVGVPLLNISADDLSAVEARDHMVKAINLHKNSGISLQAVALSASQGSAAIAEARGRNCQFVVYTRVQALQRSRRSRDDVSGLFLALMEYELRWVRDGSPYAMGTAKGEESESGGEAIADAITRIPNRLVGDLTTFGNISSGGEVQRSEEHTSELQSPVH